MTTGLLLRHWMGWTGALRSKGAISASLVQASHSFLVGAPSPLPPPPSSSSSSSLAGSQPPLEEEEDSAWVTDCNFEELCQVMGKAWVGTTHVMGEPSKQWMTSHVDYPDRDTKLQLAVYYMGSSIAQAMRRGAVVLGRTIKGRMTAVVVLSEYNDPHTIENNENSPPPLSSTWPSTWISNHRQSWLNHLWELGVTYRLTRFALPDLLRCDIYQEQQGRSAHKAGALFNVKQGYHDETRPNGKNWSVEMIAVSPCQQGKGHGRSLLQRINQLADEANMPCYLEAAGSQNLAFYKQLGFHEASVLVIEDPTDVAGVPLTVSMMMRLPQTSK